MNLPVHRASTILFDSVGELERAKKAKLEKGQLFYGRLGTPDVFAFEDAVSSLEDGYGTVAVPSGLAACVLPLVALLQPGDHVLVTDSVYEPVRTSLNMIIARSGVSVTFFPPDAGSAIADYVQENTRLIYLESPGSLTFEIQDLPAICSVAKSRGIVTVCDNTWATGYFHQPLALGADIVVQAATKYIVGHSDAMLGTVTAGQEHYTRLRDVANSLGYHASPDDTFLAARGLRTLSVRLNQHYRSALEIASWLQSQPRVNKVIHPGLPSHPGHDIWKRDFSGASGLFAFVLDTQSAGQAHEFVEALKIFRLGFSWGGFESLVLHADPSHSRTATSWSE